MRSSKSGIIVIGYSVLILAWFTSWLLVGDATWWLTLVNRIVPFLFIPVPFLFGRAIYVRRLRLIIPLLIPIFIFVQLYHPYLFPRFVTPFASVHTLKVMTYNVLFSNSDYEAIAGVILNYLPDVVALQEVQPTMMSELEQRLGEEYPYSLMGTQNDYGTTAVFSRHPIIESSVLDLQADRPAVVVKIKLDNQEFTFVAVHLLAYNLWWTKPKDIPATVMERTFNQNRQVELVLERIKEDDGTVIIGCDCNSYETSSSYRNFDEGLDNSTREVGWVIGGDNLLGTKQDTYLQHIDYIWYRGTIEPISVFKVTDSGGSDHFPVLAIFKL
ncbi:MAG: endonuclease/exonuclease/phosphatase family protein [Anaerolineae bacterium]|nr:endonuclease/exonuclease/phosphatase family protein [Anaerolineae bacterium]